ncbi:MAG: hypothetical protein RR400_03290 [Clostridia bacterium]
MKTKKVEKGSLDEIQDALYRKALGYDCDEVIEEFVPDEYGKFNLAKRKVTKKHFQPDISAAKVLLEYFSKNNKDDMEGLSDDELMNEKIRLLEMLKEINETNDD